VSASRIFGEDAAGLGEAALELTAFEDEILSLTHRELPSGSYVDAHVHLGRDADGHELSADDLVADLDRTGVSRAICFAPNAPGSDGAFTDANDLVLAAAGSHPERIVPFARVDPGHGAPEEIARTAKGGARGLKLHPVAQRFRPEAEESIAAVRAASELGWPTVIHAGFGARALARPIRELAEAVPDATLVLAHAGRGDARALAAVAREYPGIWFDTSLATLVDVVGLPPSRLLFGSDRPYGEQASALRLVALAGQLAGWTDDESRAVLGRNAEILIGAGP
jgi:predicted TIM-barrel fold metal-dependent hydrolase